MTLISDLFWAYLVAITLLTITPGVDTLLVMRNTGRGGLRDGCVTSVGICSGLFIHATLSALGISLLLVETAWAFSALKWAGACYLVWLGIGSLLQALRRGDAPAAKDVAVARRKVGLAVSFREGLLSNVLNPKTALFYMALLPQFVAMLWQCGLAWVVVTFRSLGVNARVKRTLNGLTGGFFVAMGAKLAST